MLYIIYTILCIIYIYIILWDFPGGSAVKNPPANTGDSRDAGSIPGSGRFPGEGNGNPLQYSCLSLAGYSPQGRERGEHDWVTQQPQQSEHLDCLIFVFVTNSYTVQTPPWGASGSDSVGPLQGAWVLPGLGTKILRAACPATKKSNNNKKSRSNNPMDASVRVSLRLFWVNFWK